MSQMHSIQQLYRKGETVTAIAEKVGVSRTTVYAKLRQPADFSPRPPAKGRRGRVLDQYAPVISSWLDEDEASWRKQRHTAHRVWTRLRDELGVECGESTVRQYLREMRAARKASLDARASYLDLEWAPGEAQADFGEADFCWRGEKARMSFFVLSFPYSNMGFAQVFPSENAECVCQALKQVFEHVGGVPSRIVFDNATGVGRRVCDKVRTTELFGRLACHYGFDYSFCNPNAGHEKGNVEGKVRYVRANLFVPAPRFLDVAAYNERLLGQCDGLAKDHYAKGEPEAALFAEDRLAMGGLPQSPFDVVVYEVRKADKQGKVQVGGPHRYSTDPALAGRSLTVGLGATTVRVYTEGGELVCEHERAYGSAPTDTCDPASQLPLLSLKLGGWRNSKVRSALPDDVRSCLDAMGREDLGRALRVMRSQVRASGWDATVEAVSRSLAATGRVDEASVAVSAAAAAGAPVAYDEPVDLAAYDAALRPEGGAR